MNTDGSPSRWNSTALEAKSVSTRCAVCSACAMSERMDLDRRLHLADLGSEHEVDLSAVGLKALGAEQQRIATDLRGVLGRLHVAPATALLIAHDRAAVVLLIEWPADRPGRSAGHDR